MKPKQNSKDQEQQFMQLSDTNRLKVLGEVTAGIAHELNQPLTAIVNRCAAAKYRIDSDNPDLGKIKEALNSIEEQALRSGEIIKQLRARVKTKDNQYIMVDLNEVLGACLKFINIEGLFSNTCIITKITAQLPVVNADAIQIQQVVLDLIRNASDAMRYLPRSERSLTLSAIQHDDSTVQISVSDNRKSISEQQEEKLFQSFYSSKDNGIGMGLSISHTIIAEHQGLFWFSRDLERGVTFHFTLPPR